MKTNNSGNVFVGREDAACERIIVQSSDILRNTLRNNMDIASKLLEEGRITDSDLMNVLKCKENKTEQADFLLRLVIDRRCCKLFMMVLRDLEPCIWKCLETALNGSDRSIDHADKDSRKYLVLYDI